MKDTADKYSLSFTAASLKVPEMVRFARYLADHNDNMTLADIDPGLVMRRPNARTNQREFRELAKRMQCLTAGERSLLMSEDAQVHKQMVYLSVCKAYPIVRDFILEVIREKFLLLDNHLSESDFRVFLNRNRDLHPEIDTFSDSTLKKGKQVLYKMLEQSGIINDVRDRQIVPQFVTLDVVQVVTQDQPSYLKLFLMSDLDLKMYSV